MKKKNNNIVYYVNITILIILIIFNIVIRRLSYVQISEVDGAKSIIVVKRFGEYFGIITIGSLIILLLTLLLSLIYINCKKRKQDKRLETFASYFRSANLIEIDENLAEDEQEMVIIKVWNESINEIENIKRKRYEYFNSMVHDFKMPIQLSKSSVELYNLVEGENIYVKKIENQLQKFENEVNRLLILEKIQYFEIVQIENYNLNELLLEIVDPINAVDVDKISVVCNPQKKISTDNVMFKKILNNLFDNALKHGLNSKIEVIVTENDLTISNRCSDDLNYEEDYNKPRVNSENGNGLGSQIISTYADKLELSIVSRAKSGYYVTNIVFN